MKTTEKESGSIFSAIISGDLNKVKELLKTNSASAIKVHGELKLTPLQLAIGGDSKNAISIIKILLLISGGNLRRNGELQSSLLHFAAKNSCMPAVIHFLVSYGANVDAKEGALMQTPLHIALESKNSDIAIALVDCGANIYTENSKGEKPLDLADEVLKVQLVEYFELYKKHNRTDFGKEITTALNHSQKSGSNPHNTPFNNSVPNKISLR